MFGAILKTYYAEQNGIDPEKIFVVSVMPCVAKKFECGREEMEVNGNRDVDAVISTRELARMIKQAGINFKDLPDEKFDNPFEEASGAGVIFGATGGVMEAALRTVAEKLTGKELDNIEFAQVRGTDGIKTALVPVGDLNVRIAVAHGLGNARALLDSIKNGDAEYDFIEIMACPGGCVTGGGQPIVSAKTQMSINLKAERAKALYTEDANSAIRKSHENLDIKKLYDEFLGEPGGHKAHELLHTHYTQRSKF